MTSNSEEYESLDPANLLPFTMKISENEWGHAIEGRTYNEPYES